LIYLSLDDNDQVNDDDDDDNDDDNDDDKYESNRIKHHPEKLCLNYGPFLLTILTNEFVSF